MRKLALKKLKSTDLSFFSWYLREHPQAKQKAFNLDKRIMRELFPAIVDLLEPLPSKKTLVDLILLGPGHRGPHSLARKVKIDAKNLRLNGEVVHGPADDPERYSGLRVGDFAVIEFIGGAVPEVVKVVLVAAGSSEDASLHAVLTRFLPKDTDSMTLLSEEQLDLAVTDAGPDQAHPIRDWTDQVALEEVGHGDVDAITRINRRRAGRGLTLEELRRSKEAAERIGEEGKRCSILTWKTARIADLLNAMSGWRPSTQFHLSTSPFQPARAPSDM